MKSIVLLVLSVAACFPVAGCGSGAGGEARSVPDLSLIRALSRGQPIVTFNGCLIAAGQPTWANILLTRAKGRYRGPYRAVWSIDGKVDTSDPQREIAAPGEGTRLELLVRLHRAGQTFRIQVFNAYGFVGRFSFTNTAQGGLRCDRDGRPEPSAA
jgi:hypothetical protein